MKNNNNDMQNNTCDFYSSTYGTLQFFSGTHVSTTSMVPIVQ